MPTVVPTCGCVGRYCFHGLRMESKKCNNVENVRVPASKMTREEASKLGYSRNKFLNFGTWQKVTISGPATIVDLNKASVVYIDLHGDICRAWSSAFFENAETYRNVDKIMQGAGFVWSGDGLLEGLPSMKLAELYEMGCSGGGWKKKMLQTEYERLF